MKKKKTNQLILDTIETIYKIIYNNARNDLVRSYFVISKFITRCKTNII